MDPNLEKIKDHNIRLINKKKYRLPILQARHYLTYILTEYNQPQIESELYEFESHIKNIGERHGQEKAHRKAHG